ncbi:hypothetical protein B4907_13980 [Yersinia kristensenii]|nr:hypothetical protein B4907_13980 [Yersinia kristensenii]
MRSMLIYRALRIFLVDFMLPKCDPTGQKSKLALNAYNFEQNPSNSSIYPLKDSMNAGYLHNYAF